MKHKLFKSLITILLLSSISFTSCAQNNTSDEFHNDLGYVGAYSITSNLYEGVENKTLLNKDKYDTYHISYNQIYYLEIDFKEPSEGCLPSRVLSKNDVRIYYDSELLLLDPIMDKKSPDTYYQNKIKFYIHPKKETFETKIDVIILDKFLEVIKLSTSKPINVKDGIKTYQAVYGNVMLNFNKEDFKILDNVVNYNIWEKTDLYGIPSEIKAYAAGKNDEASFLYGFDFNNAYLYRINQEYDPNEIVLKTTLELEEVQKVKSLYLNHYEKLLKEEVNFLTIFKEFKTIKINDITKIKLIDGISSLPPGSLKDIYTITNKDYINEFYNSLINKNLKRVDEERLAPGTAASEYIIYTNNKSCSFRVYNNIVYINDKQYKFINDIPGFNKDNHAYGFITYQDKYKVLDLDNKVVKTRNNIDEFEFVINKNVSYKPSDAIGYIDAGFDKIIIINNTDFILKDTIYSLTNGLTFKSLLND